MNKYQLPIVDSSAVPQVALDSMNLTHMEEVELVNHLGSLLQQGFTGKIDEALITATLDEWVEHTRDHFSRENQLMQEYGFPAFPTHSEEHEKVLAQIEDLLQQWSDNKSLDSLADFLFIEWPRWFEAHVTSMDRVTAEFLSQQMLD